MFLGDLSKPPAGRKRLPFNNPVFPKTNSKFPYWQSPAPHADFLTMLQQALKGRGLPSKALLTKTKKHGSLLVMAEQALKEKNLFFTFFLTKSGTCVIIKKRIHSFIQNM
jgi:hypothetical protein